MKILNIKNSSNFDSTISKFYEDIKKEELYSSYLNTFNEVMNQTLLLPNLTNVGNTLYEDIKNMTLNLYINNYNKFQENFSKEDYSLNDKEVVLDLI